MHQTCKLILLGNGSVGKSSLIARFVRDGFDRVYKQTVGVDFFEKRLDFMCGKSLVLQVWDIGGQSIGSAMLPSYVSQSQCIMLCYDVTDPGSLRDVEDWHRLAVTALKGAGAERGGGAGSAGASLFLVGNKVDLVHLRKVSDEEHEAAVSRLGLDGGFFVSANSGDEVVSSFYRAAAASMGIKVSDYELETLSRVVVARVTTHEEGRTAMADQIEREDREAMERAQRHKPCCSLQ